MTGLIAKPNFEDIAARLDSPFEIKKPDRLAKFILESPTLASFDETWHTSSDVTKLLGATDGDFRDRRSGSSAPWFSWRLYRQSGK